MPKIRWSPDRRKVQQRLMPSYLLEQAMDDTFPGKTWEHWLWFTTYHLLKQDHARLAVLRDSEQKPSQERNGVCP